MRLLYCRGLIGPAFSLLHLGVVQLSSTVAVQHHALLEGTLMPFRGAFEQFLPTDVCEELAFIHR